MLAAINSVNMLIIINDGAEPNNLQQLNKINVQFSIVVALRLLSIFIIMDDKIDLNYKMHFSSDLSYIFPDISSKDETYEDTLIRSLALSKYTNHMDLPLIAHILFLIEKYHVAKCELNNV